MSKIRLGYAMSGSFCMLSSCIDQMELLYKGGYDILPIMSFNAYNLDTKFGDAIIFRDRVKKICKKEIISTITDAEPIGPKGLVDLMVVAPCTGNTMAKLCNAITDTPVTLAVKSQLRVNKPVVIALATNDALGASGFNFGRMLNTKNIYFVPIGQDDSINKPNSMVAHMRLIPDTIKFAFEGKQIQPVID